jgi:hypothetical protein
MDGRGFLAGDIARRCSDEIDRNGGCERLAGGTLEERALHAVASRGVLGADVQDDAVRADRIGRQLGTVQYEVRPAGDEASILDAEGLALCAVDEYDRRTVCAAGHRCPLPSDRECGAAAAEQSARLEGLRQAPTDCRGGQRTEPAVMFRQGLGAGVQGWASKESCGHGHKSCAVIDERPSHSSAAATTSDRQPPPGVILAIRRRTGG